MASCSQCTFAHPDPNVLEGHVRNVHGWKTPPSVHSTLPKRCDYALPGLGRCVDTSGVAHGHHFKPGQLDPELVLTLEEARALVDYMLYYAVDERRGSILSVMLARLHAHVQVIA